jgi:hypothetical protein
MTAPHDLDRQLIAFLEEGPTELPDPSFDAVRDRMEQTPQRVVIGPWRMPTVNKIVPIGLGAAAVVVALVVGSQYLGPPAPAGVGSTASASPSPTAEPSPSATPSPAVGGLPVGPHLILTGQNDAGAVIHPPLTVTIPAPGWDGDVGGGILAKVPGVPPEAAGMIIFTQREYIVYGDACHWRTTIPETPVTTVDAFVDALSSQGSRDASAPVDITLGGYAGKSITLEVPADVDFTTCDPGYGGSWDCGGDGVTPCGYHGGPGAIDTVYILDVEGLIMAWQTGYFAGTPAKYVAELEAIVQSASFGE